MRHDDYDGLSARYAYVGLLLHLLRARRGMGVSILIAAMQAHDCTIDRATYHAMEAGISLPDDAALMIHAYCDALRLTVDEQQVLLSLWAFELLRQELGEGLALQCLGREAEEIRPAIAQSTR